METRLDIERGTEIDGVISCEVNKDGKQCEIDDGGWEGFEIRDSGKEERRSIRSDAAVLRGAVRREFEEGEHDEEERGDLAKGARVDEEQVPLTGCSEIRHEGRGVDRETAERLVDDPGGPLVAR